MNKYYFLLLFETVFSINSCAQLRVVLTAALTDSHYEFRKSQYIETLMILAGYGYHDVYVVEALKKQGPTLLDDYSKNVFYSSANNQNLDHRNFGINEAKTLLEGLKYFDFDSEDMIVKMNGRSQPTSDKFLSLVKNNPDYDIFIRMANGGVFTLCFAIKNKYLLEWLENIDYVTMEKNMTTLEAEFYFYINRKLNQKAFKVFFVDELGMKYNYLGSTTLPGHPEEVKFF